MKLKHALILIVTGFCIDFVAGLSKILHYRFGDVFFILATILKVCGTLLLLYKLLTNPKLKEMLNK